MIPIYQPFLSKDSLSYAHLALESTWISNLGEYKEKASTALCEILQTKHCILTNNGTSATHLIYKALKYKVPNLKNILVPNNVFVAAWNALIYDNDDINLVPIQTNSETWNIDIETLITVAKKYDPKDTAILIVHNIGGIIDVPNIKSKLKDFEIIEDNCEGLFGKYEKTFSGTSCLASSASFYANKTITCGEGGAIFFKDDDLFEFLNKTHSQGQTQTRYLHDIIGYNHRMTNVQAAILFGQLKNLSSILKRKEEIFKLYKENLKQFVGIGFQKEEKNCQNANWLFAIRIKNNKSFEQANNFFSSNNIEIRNMFFPMSYHKHLKKYSNPSIENTDITLSKEIIMFPSSPSLTNEQVNYISNKIVEYIQNNENFIT